MQTFSDKELVEKIVCADLMAFKILYQRYYNSVYRFLFHRTNSIFDIDDLIQELFIRIWQNKAKLNPDKSFKAYLFTVAHTISIDFLRKKAREKKRFSSLIPKLLPQEAELLPDKSRVRNAIAKLPEKFQTVFVLNRFEGFKYAEMASICKVSVKTVEYRMRQAMKMLVEFLQEPNRK